MTICREPRRRALVLFLVLIPALPACRREESRWDEAQAKTRRNAPAVAEEAVSGGAFNKYFPKAGDGFDLVYSQEKPGFAQAALTKDGTDVATLSVFDISSNPSAADKFRQTDQTFEGYPLADIGSKGTAVLVADRFQVQIRSKDDSFSSFEREDWLKKFDLAGLAKLK